MPSAPVSTLEGHELKVSVRCAVREAPTTGAPPLVMVPRMVPSGSAMSIPVRVREPSATTIVVAAPTDDTPGCQVVPGGLLR